jgi:hypothetical protein
LADARTTRQVLQLKTKVISIIVFIFTLSLSALVGAPSQADGSITSVSNGVVSAKGTTVTGTYVVDCDFFDERIFVNLDLRQRGSGKAITSASFSDSFLCEGNGVPVTRSYNFSNSPTAFKSGVATVTGRILACLDFRPCTQESISQQISLVKK